MRLNFRFRASARARISGRLAQPGTPSSRRVAADEEAGQHAVDDVGVPDDHFADLGLHGPVIPTERFALRLRPADRCRGWMPGTWITSLCRVGVLAHRFSRRKHGGRVRPPYLYYALSDSFLLTWRLFFFTNLSLRAAFGLEEAAGQAAGARSLSGRLFGGGRQWFVGGAAHHLGDVTFDALGLELGFGIGRRRGRDGRAQAVPENFVSATSPRTRFSEASVASLSTCRVVSVKRRT